MSGTWKDVLQFLDYRALVVRKYGLNVWELWFM